MSDHDFEQQVRQKLSDLKVTPSPAAWEKIESGLRGDRRPRARFLWAALLLLVAGGGYLAYQFMGSDDPRQPATVARAAAAGETGVPSADVDIISPKEGLAISDPAGAAPPIAFDGVSTAPAGESVTPVETPVAPASESAAPAGELPEPTGESETPSKTPTEPTGESATLAEPPTALTSESETPVAPTGESAAPTNELPELANESATLAEPSVASTSESVTPPGAPLPSAIAQQPLITGEAPEGKTSTHALPATQRDPKKLSFAVTAFSGASTVKESIQLFSPGDRVFVEDIAASSPQFNAPSVSAPNINNPIPNAIPSYKPSPISPGFSYALGVEAKRQLGDRLSVSAGIRYLQLNTRTVVGRQEYGSQIVNNGSMGYLSVSNYFRVEPEQRNYQNRYHFIDLPVELQVRLGKGSSLPLYWNAGLAMSQLLQSNALHFDGTTGVYYQNDNLLNRTQLAASTGFSIGLLNKTAVPLVIGPTLRYHVSEILRKEVTGSKHFSSLGLQLKVFIK